MEARAVKFGFGLGARGRIAGGRDRVFGFGWRLLSDFPNPKSVG